MYYIVEASVRQMSFFGTDKVDLRIPIDAFDNTEPCRTLIETLYSLPL